MNKGIFLCIRDQFGNYTHTFGVCTELMLNSVNDFTLEEQRKIYAYNIFFTLVFIVLCCGGTLWVTTFILSYVRFIYKKQ